MSDLSLLPDPSAHAAESRWMRLVAPALLVLLLVVVGVLLAPRFLRNDRLELRGVRLGYSALDTRERFQTPGPGQWTNVAGAEPILRWTPLDPASPVHAAVFEFHDGMLVAARLALSPAAAEAKGGSLEQGSSWIVARRAGPGGEVDLTALSRGCPTHAAEVSQLLAGATPGR